MIVSLVNWAVTTLVFFLVQVLFSESAEEKIQQLAKTLNLDPGSQRAQAAHLLHNTVNVINQV